MANGSVYRRDDRKKPWIAHISWHEGDRRRQSKKSYSTKKEAQSALAEVIDAHRRQEFVAPTVIRLRDFFETWIDTLETQGRKVSTIVDELSLRMVRTWALNAVAHATALAQTDPTWGTEAHPVGDGWLILSGRDMYVNRAMAVGISRAVSNDDVDLVLLRCRQMGVQAAFEVTPSTLPATVERLDRYGFVHDPGSNVTALVRPIPGPQIDTPDDFVVRRVRGENNLALWQEVSASGWGHVDQRARHVSDAFTTAAHVTDGDGMMIAFDANGERPVGCASVTIRDGLATLGAMSTHPDHRRQGVQASLVRHRLLLAAQRGCDQAVTTAVTGGPSERNLRRQGFRPVFEIATWKS